MNTPPPYQPVPPPYYEDDEITLKELILKIKEYAQEVGRYKWVLILLGLLLGGAMLIRAYFQDTQYTAGLTFLISSNEVKSKEESLFDPVAFGSITGNKIPVLVRSGRIVNKILLQKTEINGENDFFANHLINIYELNKNVELEEEKVYITNSNIGTYSRKEYQMMSRLKELLVGNKITGKNGIVKTTYNKDTEIYQLDVVSKNGELSMKLLESLFEELKVFHTEETVGRLQKYLVEVKVEEDSIAKLLRSKEYQLAKSSDRTLGVISKASIINLDKMNREVKRLDGIYTGVLATRRSLENTLNREAPDFQVIDQTFLPVKEEPSLVKNGLIGVLLGGFLGIVFVVGRKIVGDAMQSE